MDFRHQLGRDAENTAMDWYLKQAGMRLLARNYRCKMGELDLVFEQNLGELRPIELIFVEVRVRAQGAQVDGLSSIDWKKRLRLRRASDHFLSHYQGSAQFLRFDLLYRDGMRWVHLPNLELG